MRSLATIFNLAVAAFFAGLPAAAQETGPEPRPESPSEARPEAPPAATEAERLDQLFADLARPENRNWDLAESDIMRLWSRSGSPAADLLLKRGQEALQAGDVTSAIEHLTALTDHAPDFAEGWNARATAYYLAGQFGPSIEDIRRTLALEPRHFGALAGFGMILEETGRKEEALSVYRRVLEIHPHQAMVAQSVERLTRETAGTDL